MSIDLLQRRRAMMGSGGNPLPYDAEIEYIGGTGTQYIDTLLKGNLGTRLQVAFMSTNEVNDQGVAGSRETITNSIALLVGSSNTNQRFGSKSRTFGFLRNRQYDVIIDRYALIIDGGSYSITATDSFSTQKNICVFYVNAFNHLIGNIYSFKMWQDDELVRDFIPVRVGTTGYMYDRVSGELFGNAGTGDFILGNDK